MKIHYLQHVPFEGIGHIQTWADTHNHQVSKTELFNGGQPPSVDSYDLLIVMGGPMGIYDYNDYPWLKIEKQYLKEVLDSKKPMLGICLGAQLIADVLEAPVTAGKDKEIGWFPITKEPQSTKLGSLLPDEMIAYHWHGDTFETPKGAQRLFVSGACANQAFVYKDCVVALQFHLETTPESMQTLIENCEHELVDAPYIQSAEEMNARSNHFPDINNVMDTIMEYFTQL